MPYQDRYGNICGFLDIEEAVNSSHFLRRYFRLDLGRKVLDYFMDNPQNLPPGSKPVGSIKLEYVSMVLDGAKSRPKFPFCFYITVSGEKTYLKADDLIDKDAWMVYLVDSTKLMVPQAEKSGDRLSKSSESVTSQQSSYKAEVVGGIVLKTPIDQNDCDSESGGENGASESCQWPCNEPEAIKIGYCTKQGGMRKTWKKRYFVLNLDGLSYYKSHEERQPIRTICKSEILDARISFGIHLHRDNVLEVVTPTRVFYLQAETLAERDSWVFHINKFLSARHLPKRQEIEELNKTYLRPTHPHRPRHRLHQSMAAPSSDNEEERKVKSVIEPSSGVGSNPAGGLYRWWTLNDIRPRESIKADVDTQSVNTSGTRDVPLSTAWNIEMEDEDEPCQFWSI